MTQLPSLASLCLRATPAPSGSRLPVPRQNALPGVSLLLTAFFLTQRHWCTCGSSVVRGAQIKDPVSAWRGLLLCSCSQSSS